MKKQKFNQKLSLKKLSIATLGNEAEKIYGGSNLTVSGCTDSFCCTLDSICMCSDTSGPQATCAPCATHNC